MPLSGTRPLAEAGGAERVPPKGCQASSRGVIHRQEGRVGDTTGGSGDAFILAVIHIIIAKSRARRKA